MACAVLPDIDSIGFALGIPYGSLFGHRGLTHSLLFALITGVTVTGVFFRNEIRAGSELRSDRSRASPRT